MGILIDSIKALALRPPTTQAVAATVPVGMNGVPANPPYSFERNAREGYMRDELVYACVEMLATSAAEPRLVAYRGDEKIDDHPLIDLWNTPNPFMDRYGLAASLIMFREIGGNAYIEKVRNGAGQVLELWVMRSDRVKVIPSDRTFVGGYQYQVGAYTYDMAPTDVIHFKTRHPLDDFYGLPTLAPLAGRVDLDNWMRDFTRSFFLNAGVPAGLLNIKRSLDAQEKELLRARFRQEYGGPAGWHQLMLIDGDEASYTAMGLPLGARGLAAPELDEINEARICMAFGVPPSLVGARVGMQGSGLAGGNREQDQENLWQQTLVPLYREMGATVSRGFGLGRRDASNEYPDIDRVEFDMSDVKALAEDVDKLSTRVLDQFAKGAITRREARVALGYPPEPDDTDVYFVPVNVTPTPSDSEIPDPTDRPEPLPGDAGSPAYAGALPGANGRPGPGSMALNGANGATR